MVSFKLFCSSKEVNLSFSKHFLSLFHWFFLILWVILSHVLYVSQKVHSLNKVIVDKLNKKIQINNHAICIYSFFLSLLGFPYLYLWENFQLIHFYTLFHLPDKQKFSFLNFLFSQGYIIHRKYVHIKVKFLVSCFLSYKDSHRYDSLISSYYIFEFSFCSIPRFF